MEDNALLMNTVNVSKTNTNTTTRLLVDRQPGCGSNTKKLVQLAPRKLCEPSMNDRCLDGMEPSTR